MIQKIFAVYDEKAKCYATPFFMHQEGMATRLFSECINNPTHQFGKHPQDYTLFLIGLYEDECAGIETKHVMLGNGVEYKTKTEIDLDQGDLKIA